MRRLANFRRDCCETHSKLFVIVGREKMQNCIMWYTTSNRASELIVSWLGSSGHLIGRRI